MFETIIIIIAVVLALSLLIIFHELGHFLMAKKFGVKVEEFGIGFGPRIFSRKIGETTFSLNAIFLGGFVKMCGEEERVKGSGSFSEKPIWQRTLIILAGCAANWIIAMVLLGIIFGMGVRMPVADDEYNVIDPRVQIMAVASESPAYNVGLKFGDIIKKLSVKNEKLAVTKVIEVQELTEKYKGEEVILTILRGKEVLEKSLILRVSPPEGEGAMGVSLTRTAIKSYPWHEAIWRGVVETGEMTVMIVWAFGQLIESGITGEPLPPVLEDAELMGPIGIFGFMGDMFEMGIVYFLKIVAIISVHLAIINLLPIPALDGGRFVFLMIEGVRGRPLPEKIEHGLIAISFFLLIGLMIFVTIFIDIPRLF